MIENKMPDVSNLATKAALTTVEKKIPSISNLVKKTDYDTKVGEIENRIISLNRKIISNKTKDISIENELKKLKAFDLSYFRGKIILMKMVIKIIAYFNQFLIV